MPVRWESPEYSLAEVDEAGEALRQSAAPLNESESAIAILNNWRAAHRFPLNSIQMNLRRKAEQAYASALVAQRLKRSVSIISKLRLRSWITLSSMQDIGGCRAIVRTPAEVNRIRDLFLSSRAAHKLVREKDFIRDPRESGYRSLHMIYAFSSAHAPQFEGLQVEVQIRTRVQHAWATAVETVGFLINQALKSNLGEARWLEFFRLASAAFALDEGATPVPATPDDPAELRRELLERIQALHVKETLRGFSAALADTYRVGPKRVRYYLLSLSPVGEKFQIEIQGFTSDEAEQAIEAYSTKERQGSLFPTMDSVLVSVSSLDALKRSYPNYFLDTRVFLARLDRVTRSGYLGKHTRPSSRPRAR